MKLIFSPYGSIKFTQLIHRVTNPLRTVPALPSPSEDERTIHGLLEGFLGRKRNRDGIQAHGMIV